MNNKGEASVSFLWVKVISFVTAAIIFCFTTFATKEEVRENVAKRLDRLESKIDTINNKLNDN